MLANNKTSEQITEELVDLIGDNYGSSELTWTGLSSSTTDPSRA